MRKTIYILLSLFFIFNLVLPLPVFAETDGSNSEYRRIITDDTPFYQDKDAKNFLFYLPYTYYVKVLDTAGDFSHVECYGTGKTVAIDGYVPTDMLFEDGLAVFAPYPEISVYTVNSTVMYSDLTLEKPTQYVFPERELFLYGNAVSDDGINLFCVYYNGKIGYIKETETYPFTIPNHPNELTFIQKPVEPENQEQTTVKRTNSQTELKVVIILCLVFAGIIALFIAVKNKRENHAPTYYDENDYE